MHRRTLLQMALAGAALGCLPLQPFAAIKRSQTAPVLVLVELSGGNDSLNTIIPKQYLKTYQTLRPKVGLNADEYIVLDEQFFVNKAMQPLLPLWKNGDLALAHGVGYPNPNRSHFRGIEIWDTASASDEYLDNGWAAQGIKAASKAPVDALVFGRNAAPVMGQGSRYIHLANLEQFARQAENFSRINLPQDNDALRHLTFLHNDLSRGAEFILPEIKGVKPLTSDFPTTPFGRNLADVTHVIRRDLGIPLFKVALGGFDTHRRQKEVHARLLSELAQGLVAFQSELEKAGLWDRVTVMTYSEFGRRASENGSGGTDHGTAATHLVLGGKVNGGHVGQHPDLNDLLQGDMRHTTDFRRLYQTLLSDWWNREELKIPGGEWGTLPLFRKA